MRETNRNFLWQEGYWAFSVSLPQLNLERVKRYIRDQKKHREGVSFEDEYLTMLRAAKIEFDLTNAEVPLSGLADSCTALTQRCRA